MPILSKPSGHSISLSATLNLQRMLRDTLAALEEVPTACAHFKKRLPQRALPALAQMEPTIRLRLHHSDAYSMVPGRDPHFR